MQIGNWQARVQCVEAVDDASGNLENIRDNMVVGDLSENEEKVFRALLGEFSDVFSQSEHDVGYCDKIPHRINVVDTHPVKRLYRRIPVNQWDEVNSYLQVLYRMVPKYSKISYQDLSQYPSLTLRVPKMSLSVEIKHISDERIYILARNNSMHETKNKRLRDMQEISRVSTNKKSINIT